MENLIIEPSSITPDIFYNIETCVLDLKGRSSPDNSLAFYGQITNYFDEYFSEIIPEKLQINVGLEYFNTSSLKCIFEIFKKLGDAVGMDESRMEINWFYEEDDDDMLETGEDISALLDIDFNFICDEVGIS